MSDDSMADDSMADDEMSDDSMADDSMADDSMADDEMSDAGATFGDACAAVPADGEGSLEGMADDPVATAASNNPVLSTLVTAVGAADLVDTLNTGGPWTVFAPSNDAFAAIPEADMNAVMADTEMLSSILTYHVIEGRLAPEDLAGTHTTVNGAEVEVSGSDESFTVNDANVICGNVQTANATVYIIDAVLMPSAN
ncbi:MAG: fasciclin domain-containing protein [Acidimicrobiia bacterium]|nr:fasciclin domain-containing protein [Acidimicrobiia bacterium]